MRRYMSLGDSLERHRTERDAGKTRAARMVALARGVDCSLGQVELDLVLRCVPEGSEVV